jgi:hypothetical protein
MELVAEGVLNAIGGGLKTFFGQLTELLLFAFVVVSGEDSVFAAGAVLADMVVGARLVLCIGVEVVVFGSGAKGVGASVEGGDSDGAAVRAEELKEEVGPLMIGGELAEEVILMGAKPSYDVSVLQLGEDLYCLLRILFLPCLKKAGVMLQVVLLVSVEMIALKGGA